MRYPLLIFDWDGTLLDSIETIVACALATVSELGLDQPSADRVRSAIGLGLRDTVDRLAPGCDEQTYQDVVDTYRRLWWDGFHHRPRLFPGVPEMLAELSDRGHTLALATAKTRDGLVADFEATGVGERFAASRTVDETKSKPNPAMVLELLEETGRTPEQTLVIGDSVHDLQMARNARVDAVGVDTGAQSSKVLLAEQPLACLRRIQDLPGWLLEAENR